VDSVRARAPESHAAAGDDLQRLRGARARARQAQTCQVLEVPPLLRELLIEATRIDPLYAPTAGKKT
jgi:hypothetical protein